MENTCKNCGALVFDRKVLCNSCFEELSANEKKVKKERKKERKKESQKWKTEWESAQDNWFLNMFSISNTYNGAVLFYLLMVVVVVIGWILWNSVLDFLLPTITKELASIFGKSIVAVGISGFILVFSLALIIYFIRYAYRLLYFIIKRISKR